jgi:hypothetical protein
LKANKKTGHLLPAVITEAREPDCRFPHFFSSSPGLQRIRRRNRQQAIYTSLIANRPGVIPPPSDSSHDKDLLRPKLANKTAGWAVLNFDLDRCR